MRFDRAAAADELRSLGFDISPADIEATRLTHNRRNQITGGVWAVCAEGVDLVLKVITNRPGGDTHWQPSDDPQRWNFWRREADMYRSGMADTFAPFGLPAPSVIGVIDRSPRQIAIWLERVEGREGAAQDEATLIELAHRLGRGQGWWTIEERQLPDTASRRFLREYPASKTLGWELLDDDTAWSHPLVARSVPPELRDGVRRLHARRQELVAISERLPRTFAHLDLWPNNVIATEDGPIALVDWAFAGDGALGEDIGNLIPDAVFDRFLRSERMAEVAERSLTAYTEGLVESGWSGPPEVVRLGMYSAAVKYDWLMPWMLARVDAEQIDYGGSGAVDAFERYRERGRAMWELCRWADRALEMVRDDPSLTVHLNAGPTTPYDAR